MKVKVFIAILTLFISAGCIPRAVSIESAAKSVRATSLGLSVFSDIIIELHRTPQDPGLTEIPTAWSIEQQTAEKLLDFAYEANLIGLEASKFIRSLSTITPDDERKLQKILNPILESIEVLLNDTVINITNPSAQERIETALFMVRLAVMSMGDI